MFLIKRDNGKDEAVKMQPKKSPKNGLKKKLPKV